MGVGDDDVADVLERDALAEARPHLVKPLPEPLDRLVRPGAHVHERERTAVDDQVNIVHVPRKGLDRHTVDANTAPTHEFLDLVHGHYRTTHGVGITAGRRRWYRSRARESSAS